jgi:hypothetical protein
MVEVSTPPPRRIAVFSWFSLYSLGTDRTENTASKIARCFVVIRFSGKTFTAQ